MKKCLLLFSTFSILIVKVNAQNANEFLKQKETQIKYLTQQVAALQLYISYVKKGYQVAQHGLGMIEKIKDGNFNLHKDFIMALKEVNPNISNDKKTKAIATHLERAKEDFKIFVQESQKDENLSSDEKKYLLHISRALAENCERSLAELDLVLASGKIEMKDDVRLQKVNLLYLDAISKWAFVQAFCNHSKLLSLQRKKETQEIKDMKAIHDL